MTNLIYLGFAIGSSIIAAGWKVAAEIRTGRREMRSSIDNLAKAFLIYRLRHHEDHTVLNNRLAQLEKIK